MFRNTQRSKGCDERWKGIQNLIEDLVQRGE
jgi:hypothetical protein